MSFQRRFLHLHQSLHMNRQLEKVSMSILLHPASFPCFQILSVSRIDYPVIRQIYTNQPAEKSGLETGDVVKSINGKKITIGREILTYTQLHPLTGDKVEIVVERDGETKTFSIDPYYKASLFGFS